MVSKLKTEKRKFFVVRITNIVTGNLEIKEKFYNIQYDKKAKKNKILGLAGNAKRYEDEFFTYSGGSVLVKNLKNILNYDAGIFHVLKAVGRHNLLKPQIEMWIYYRKKRF